MAKSAHISFRASQPTLRRLDERARLSNEKKTLLAERYVEEGLRMDDHPGIQFTDGPLGRRPSLVGTGLDVWEVVETVRANGNSTREAAEYLEVSERLVEIAVGYYGEHREEVDAWIERVRELAEHEEARARRAREALA